MRCKRLKLRRLEMQDFCNPPGLIIGHFLPVHFLEIKLKLYHRMSNMCGKFKNNITSGSALRQPQT